VSTVESLNVTNNDREKLLDGVLSRLEDWFLLDSVIGEGTLRDRIRTIVRDVDFEAGRWGTPGTRFEVARRRRGSFSFLYRPHLFPDMDEELRLGHEVQFHLLPRTLPDDAPVAAAAVLESYCHLSGDLIGWRGEDGGGFLAWILDVSGHGIRAGFAAVVMKLLLENAVSGRPLDLLARDVEERFMAARNPDDPGIVYATGVFVRALPDGTTEILSAGHVPTFIRLADGSMESVEATGMPLALIPGEAAEVRSFRLDPGEMVILATDGLFEATDGDGRELGIEAVASVVASSEPEPAAMAESVYRLVERHHDLTRLDDDLCVLVLRRE
jgi:sigma-B regulation protein RsbU (phosphoserine phosphatase)